MQLYHKIIFVVVGIFICTTFTSCHKNKKNSGSGNVVVEEGLISGKDVKFPDSFGKWESLEIPIGITLDGEKTFSLSGKAYFINNRELLISLRMMGFEVAQIYADTDSVFLLEKYHKFYLAESMKKLGSELGVTIGDLQGFMLGQPSSPLKDTQNFSVFYKWDKKNAMLYGVGFLRNGEPAAGCSYESIVETEHGPLASKIEFAATLGEYECGGTLTYKPAQAKWNSITEPLKFKHPGKDYKLMSPASLLKGF